MAEKVTLINLSKVDSTITNDLNTNLTRLADAIDDALDRTGASPNQLEDDIDANDFQIKNLGKPTLDNHALRLADITDDSKTAAANAVTIEDTDGNFSSDNAEGALAEVAGVDTLSDLKGISVSSLSSGTTRYVRGRSSVGDGGEGHFRWTSADLSTEVGNDEVTNGEGDGGIYVAPDSDKTGASGAWVRQFVGPVFLSWWIGDNGPIDTALARAISASTTNGTGRYRGTIDLDGREWEIDSTVLVDSSFDVRIQNGGIKPSSNFTSGPFFDFNGGGNFEFESVLLAGNQTADGILVQTGSHWLKAPRIFGVPNYAVHYKNGTDNVLYGGYFQQWSFTDSENGEPGQRTADLIQCETGELLIHGTVARYANSCVKLNTGQQVMLKDCHFYNGAEPGTNTAGSETRNIVVDNGSVGSCLIDDCFIDMGQIILRETDVAIRNCHFFRNDDNCANNSFVDFQPQSSGKTIANLIITSNHFSGSVSGGAIDKTTFFTLETLNGDYSGGIVGSVVADNTYANGSDYSPVPATRGAIRVNPSNNWIASDGAYRSGYYPIRDYMFFPDIAKFRYKVSWGAIKRSGFTPGTSSTLTGQESGGTSHNWQWWADTNDDVRIDVFWDMAANDEVLSSTV